MLDAVVQDRLPIEFVGSGPQHRLAFGQVEETTEGHADARGRVQHGGVVEVQIGCHAMQGTQGTGGWAAKGKVGQVICKSPAFGLFMQELGRRSLAESVEMIVPAVLPVGPDHVRQDVA